MSLFDIEIEEKRGSNTNYANIGTVFFHSNASASGKMVSGIY